MTMFVVVPLLVIAGLCLPLVHPIVRLRRRAARTPVTDATRRLRDGRANVVLNLDAVALAYALGPYEAQLADLQGYADLLAAHDHRDVER